MSNTIKFNFNRKCNSLYGEVVHDELSLFKLHSKGWSYELLANDGNIITSEVISKNIILKFIGVFKVRFTVNRNKVDLLSRFSLSINSIEHKVEWSYGNKACNIKDLGVNCSFSEVTSTLKFSSTFVNIDLLCIILILLNHVRLDHESC